MCQNWRTLTIYPRCSDEHHRSREEERRGAPPGFLLKSCSAPLCDDVIIALILQRYKHLHNWCRALHSEPEHAHTSLIENIFKRRLRVKIECPKPDISLVPPIPLFHVIVIFKWRDVSPFWINNSMNGHWVVLISEPPSHPNDIQCSQLCHFETHFIYISRLPHMM